MNHQLQPVIFTGHGSPMNAIESNEFSRAWRQTADALPRARAILCVSAHWFTHGLRLTDAVHPKTIHDFYGFPNELYRISYPAHGAPDVAAEASALLGGVSMDNSWGLDHGAWSVLRHMFPKADIPMTMLSVDRDASNEDHYRVGQALLPLRRQGVLIFCSGNVVHNLNRVRWDMPGGLPWAQEFDTAIQKTVLGGHHEDVVRVENHGEAGKLAVPISDHYAPLLVALGASQSTDKIIITNAQCVLGSLSMTCYQFGA